jgi:hypothetical protein
MAQRRYRQFQDINQAPFSDPVKELVGDLPEEMQMLLRQLKTREAEIDQWFQADPQRLESLRKDPQKTLEELLRTMRLERPIGVEWDGIRGWEIFLEPPKPPALGIVLLTAVWQFVAQSSHNLAQFKSDPFKVVRDVAADTNASNEEREAVINAFHIVTGRTEVVPFAGGAILGVVESTQNRQPITARRVQP